MCSRISRRNLRPQLFQARPYELYFRSRRFYAALRFLLECVHNPNGMDEIKRRRNIEKHGLDFADVSGLDWDNATVLEDTRFRYPEPRYWAFAMMGKRLHMVAFCIRDGKVRVISFRKASEKEEKSHGR